MATILKLNLLGLPEDVANKLDAGAAQHKRFSNITFKVVGNRDGVVTIQTTQGKHLSENYADQKTLIERTKQLFGKFLPEGTKINVGATPYTEHIIPNLVTHEWVNQNMNDLKIRTKDIQHDTGLDRSNISAWVNGNRPMSDGIKALFFFYFACKFKNVLEDVEALKRNSKLLGMTASQYKSHLNKKVKQLSIQ